MFSAGCTMNTDSKKLQREVASTFCGAQVPFTPGRGPLFIHACLGSTFEFRRKKLVGSYLFLRVTKRE